MFLYNWFYCERHVSKLNNRQRFKIFCARNPDLPQLKKASSLESFFKSMAIGNNKPEDDDNFIGKFNSTHQQTARPAYLTVCAVMRENTRMRQAIQDVYT
jgi:hypothetical protein